MNARSKRKQEYWISSARELEVLSSPIRNQIALVMERIDPVSVKEIAAELGREPATLYYHMKIFEEVGLIHVQGTRGEGVEKEVLYSLRGSPLRFSDSNLSPSYLAGMAKICSAFLRFAERLFANSLKRRVIRASGPGRQLMVFQGRFRLSKKSLAEFNRRIDELFADLAEMDDADASDAYVLTASFAPDPNDA